MKKIVLLLALIYYIHAAFTQSVSGKITDISGGQPLINANIVLIEINKGTITDSTGFFIIKNIDPGKYMLKVSYIGYKDATSQITVSQGSNITVNIGMSPDPINAGEVTVTGELTRPVKRTADVIYTGSAVTDKGIGIGGSQALNSVYNAIDILPGVNVESNEPYGLSAKSMRIRCVSSYFSGMTIEGFPNYGIMPIGARDNIYDTENMEYISIYKGATPADLGTATGNKGGAIELKYKRPSDRFGVTLNQSAGMNNYLRTFVRIDPGKLKTGTRIFSSFSYSMADKWKGAGTLGPRYNAAAGISQKINKKISADIFMNYNDAKRHDFRKLTYEQAADIENNFDLDYNPKLTGDPAQDVYYYDYNGGGFTNKDIMGSLLWELSNAVNLELKTYYSLEDADYLESTMKGPYSFVFNRVRDCDRLGVIPEIRGTLGHISYAAGYWFESADHNASVYSSSITADGLMPQGYSYFTVSDARSTIHNPYAKISYSKKHFSLQAGIKYFYYFDSESERYSSVTPTELTDDPDPDLHTDDIIHAVILPTFGAGYIFSEKLQAYVNYGRNYMRPYMYDPIISLYVRNKQIFTDNGITLQSIFDTWIMETSDNFDAGIRYSGNKLFFFPSLFYAKHHNVLTSVYDPVLKLDYYQNVGELTAFGADIECYFKPVKSIYIFINPAYSSMSYDNDLLRQLWDTSMVMEIKGNQSPECPVFMVYSGVIYTWKNIDISSTVKHTGIRYGDATNQEKLNDYTLVNCSVHYKMKNILKLKELSIGCDIRNIINTKYIGMIYTSDDANQGSAMYYSGIPRTVVFSLSIKI